MRDPGIGRWLGGVGVAYDGGLERKKERRKEGQMRRGMRGIRG